MKSILIIFILSFLVSTKPTFGQNIYMLYDKSSVETNYAVGKLTPELQSKGYKLVASPTDYQFLINLEIESSKIGPESYVIKKEDNKISVLGGDERGLIYGTLSLAESLRNGFSLPDITYKSEKPHFPLRAIKHNTAWYSYRPSSALDLHYETLRDVKYWEAFLDMMVENRFNSLSIWNLHPFVFMIQAKNFPEASPFSPKEMEEWKTLHKSIFRMAKERAIETYIIPFNIFVSHEFAKAHNVAQKNVYPHYYVPGDTSEIVKRYMRESVTQLLVEYPELTGFGLTLGEGMAGMTPQQREDWMFETYIEGMRLAGRPVKLVHRIPFSSTTESLGATSVELEKLTRNAIEREAKLDFIDGPIWADLKYNWSHAHSTPKLVKVHGGEMFDTFYNPLPDGYKVTYTARNEDFFALRWGVPQFIRDHIGLNSQSYVGGYFVGSESYIPAKDYFTAIKGPVDWKFAFQRQWLFYKLWGRLLYNPQTPDDVFVATYKNKYGEAGQNLLEAMALASSTQLKLGSLYDSRWDFTLYGEGMMALIGDSTKYISADRLINQPTLDPDYVSVKDYVAATKAGKDFAPKKITPPVLIGLLEKDCLKALKLIENVDAKEDNSLMYELADIRIWANLGLHLAEKLKGSIALQSYREGLGEQYKTEAISAFTKGLEYWDQVISISRPIYKDMPLAHYNGSSHDRNDDNLFHWALIRDEVANDIELAKSASVSTPKK
ncbi:glycoside hydrolase family 20 zincin-like fold domain-containing protein [Cognataquiflexum rubidum]|uniref:glycoside hydrolase family 20 zincin-like fold domain-containing protein n=1 Tax=Cognataquiflexum rubidum TaxID=2922273 RepID=UPI001F1378D6|nr:glycoside hydrolase family 20 zincin-like fold domain-containing protein [Cognataquiflexum rubidum]MCH6233168.1 glycoside hydrolase family 20 zincin-like fold domain-containing protein [Cognataquiflexum rubidum]